MIAGLNKGVDSRAPHHRFRATEISYMRFEKESSEDGESSSSEASGGTYGFAKGFYFATGGKPIRARTKAKAFPAGEWKRQPPSGS